MQNTHIYDYRRKIGVQSIHTLDTKRKIDDTRVTKETGYQCSV